MSLTVVKFGGSSLADAEHFKNAAKIVTEDSARKYVVVSAPGKRFADDTKITDLLLQSLESSDHDSAIDAVAVRFQDIICELGLDLSIDNDIAEMKAAARLGIRDFLVSRGEYLSAKIMAALLNYDFVDAGEAIRFDAPTRCNYKTSRKNLEAILKKSSHAVIPGFYGADFNGNICTFLRGGSDITGSIVADAIAADLYENWTDVSGVMAADPRIIANPLPIQVISYEELRTFSHLGASVMHEDALLPCKRTGIPIMIKNSNQPWDQGTLVVSGQEAPLARNPIAVGAKKDLSLISVSCQNADFDIRSHILRVLHSFGIAPEHIAVKNNCCTVIAPSKIVMAHEQDIIHACSAGRYAHSVMVKHNLSMIGAIGRVSKFTAKMVQSIANHLANAGISIELLDSGFDFSCVIALVSQDDNRAAVNTIYRELVQSRGVVSEKRHQHGIVLQPA